MSKRPKSPIGQPAGCKIYRILDYFCDDKPAPVTVIVGNKGDRVLWNYEINGWRGPVLESRPIRRPRHVDETPAGLACYEWGMNHSVCAPSRRPQTLAFWLPKNRNGDTDSKNDTTKFTIL